MTPVSYTHLNLTLPMPEALDGYYEDIVTYAIPLERQPEDTSLKDVYKRQGMNCATAWDCM